MAYPLWLCYSEKGIIFSHCPDKLHDKCHLREGCFSSRFGGVKSIVTREAWQPAGKEPSYIVSWSASTEVNTRTWGLPPLMPFNECGI